MIYITFFKDLFADSCVKAFLKMDASTVCLAMVFVTLTCGRVFSQGLIPTNMPVIVHQISTNGIIIDGQPMIPAGTSGCVNPYGIIGVVADSTGTNYSVVKADSTVVKEANITLITDPAGGVHAQVWRSANYLSTTDMINWQTNTAFTWAVYDLPRYPMFLCRFPTP
jgi:hypothetical protein